MNYAIVDTGTSLTYIIPSDFTLLSQQIVSLNIGLTCDADVCSSSTQTCDVFTPFLSPISFNLGQIKVTIPPNGYVLNNINGYACLIAVVNSGSNLQPYVLGDSFMRNFYTSFDYKTKEVSFAVSSNAPVGVLIERSFTGGVIAGIVIGVVVCAIIIGAIIWKVIQRRKANN